MNGTVTVFIFVWRFWTPNYPEPNEDSQTFFKWNDGADNDHGRRGGELARDLHAEGLLSIDEAQLDLLIQACGGHTDIIHSDIATIACCSDADRLDLTRLGIHPDPAMLNTGSAKEIAREVASTDLLPLI